MMTLTLAPPLWRGFFLWPALVGLEFVRMLCVVNLG
jgi:hypothetical protein